MARRTLTLAALIGGLATACRTPSVYEVRYHDPARVRAVLAGAFDAAVESLPPAAVGPGTPLHGESVQVLGAELPRYSAQVDRVPDGTIVFRFLHEAGAPATIGLVNPRGRLMPTFPTSTGDLLDFPGLHQRGVTAVGAGPLSQMQGELGLHLVYRPDYDVQRALGRRSQVDITLLTPRDNVASVLRLERPPRGALWFGFIISSIIGLGGGAVAASTAGSSDAARDVGLAIGLPLVGVGVAAGVWCAAMLLRADRDVPIPLDSAVGSP